MIIIIIQWCCDSK